MKLLEGFKVLVVDDDEMLREMIAYVFKRNGAHVLEAENGTTAFDLVQKNNFDVVFSDVRMPGGDGIELAENISKLSGKRPLVFICTGFSDLTPEKAKELSVSEIFEKPFDHSLMIEKIAVYLKTAIKKA